MCVLFQSSTLYKIALCNQFLDYIGLSIYKDLFNNEDLNMEILRQIDDEDLKSIGVKSFGHRFKIKEGLKNYVDPDENTPNGIEENSEVPPDLIPDDQEDDIHQPEDHLDDPSYENVVFFEKELLSGRKTHHISVDFYRFDRNTVKNNGRAYFLCSHPGCKATVIAKYSSRENKNNEEPVIENDSIPPPSSHTLSDGTVHPFEIGLRLKEKCKANIKTEIENNPLKSVGTIYEEEFQRIKVALDPIEREEFVSAMPMARQLERSMYLWRGRVLPANPPTQRDIDTTSQFTLDSSGTSIIVGDWQGEDENCRILLLSSQEIIEFLRRRHRENTETVSRLGIDATFKVSPGNYHQVL